MGILDVFTKPSQVSEPIKVSEPVDKITEQTEAIEQTEIDDETIEENIVRISPQQSKEQLEKLTQKPVNAKQAELDFYKFYAATADGVINKVIETYGSDTEKILNELERMILQHQRDISMIKVYEQHTRLRRAVLIKERSAQKIEKQRSTDLNYVPMLDGEQKVTKKVRKQTVTKGLNQRDRLIADLVAKGLTKEQALKLIG